MLAPVDTLVNSLMREPQWFFGLNQEVCPLS
jgi:hypothetical protein